MKRTIVIANALTLVALLGCGPTDQQRELSARAAKANSPECLAAKTTAAKERADTEATNLSIRENNKTRRMELDNLRLEDKIAELEGRPIRNRMKEALLENAIRMNEVITENEEGQPALMDSLNHFMIQQACELTDTDLVAGKFGLRPPKYTDCLKLAAENHSIVCKQVGTQ
jgi:hypothetical protein